MARDPARSAPPRPIESRWVCVGPHRVHARVAERPASHGRDPVVLVHGLGMSSRYMLPLARLLASDFEIHAPDLPGFGLSDKPRHALGVRELADALAGYLDAARIDRAQFIGNSLGCEILVELALRHPGRVSRLVLQGPTADPEDRTALGKILLFPVTGLFERWSLGWIALTEYLRSGIRRYIATFNDMIAHRIAPKLPKVTAPTLIVWGTRDYIVPRLSVARFADLMPHGRLVVVPGAAHGMNYSHPAQLRGAILPFLLGAAEPDGAPAP